MTYYYIVDKGTRVIESELSPDKVRKSYVQTTAEVRQKYVEDRQAYVDRWHKEAAKKRERAKTWSSEKYEQYYGEAQKARTNVYATEPVQTKALQAEAPKSKIQVTVPEKSYEQRVMEAKAVRQTESKLDPAIQQRIYGRVVSERPTEAGLILEQAKEATMFKQKFPGERTKTVAQARLEHNFAILRKKSKDYSSPEFNAEANQLLAEYKKETIETTRAQRMQAKVEKLQEWEKKASIRAGRVEKVNSYITLGWGKPIEERSFIGETSQKFAGLTTYHATVLEQSAIAGAKIRIITKHRDIIKPSELKAAKAVAKTGAWEEATDPSTMVATAAAVGIAGAVSYARGAKPAGAYLNVKGKGRNVKGQTIRYEYTIRDNARQQTPTETIIDVKPKSRVSEFVRRQAESARETFKRQAESAKEKAKEWFKREKQESKSKDITESKSLETWRRKIPSIFERGLRIYKPRNEISIWPVREIEIRPKPTPQKDLLIREQPEIIKDHGRDIVPDRGRDLKIRDKNEVKEYYERITEKPRREKIIREGGRMIIPLTGWPNLKVDLPGGGGLFPSWKEKSYNKKDIEKSYFPSISAIAFNIMGRKPGATTGLELRPIKR